MHLDKGNKLDEVLRKKLESHNSEVDPQLWDKVLDDVGRGDRTNGILLTLGSLFLAISLFLGYHHIDPLESRSGISALVDQAYTSISAVEGIDPLPGEQFDSRGVMTPLDSRDEKSASEDEYLQERIEENEAVTYVHSLPPKVENQFIAPNDIAQDESNKEAERMVAEISDSLVSTYASDPIAYSEKKRNEVESPLTPLESRGLLGVFASAPGDERTLKQISKSLEPMPNTSVNGRWGAEILVGPSLNYRTFEAEESQAFTDHKNESDSRLISANTEILIHYQPNEQWIFSMGIGRMNTGENYSYTLRDQTHEFKNEYHYLTIPVRAKYRIWDLSPGLGLYAGAGAQLGFLQEGTSSWVDIATEQAVTHSNKGVDSPFRNEVISGEIDLMIRLALSERIFISAQERGTYAINSVYQDETGLEQHQFSFDTLFGLGLRF